MTTGNFIAIPIPQLIKVCLLTVTVCCDIDEERKSNFNNELHSIW
jgi:hypothetical protein